ncbi:hypothetical protein [Phytobacter diazotrophicus]|jgi:hypothetical protein|uniref:hypothetical protein n=1 Tax=Phytobacter diazotrophicus TaxID=395631 RepID=UPI00104C322D|nr:hypothetical protein EDC53_12055 [Phytobacter diazotrophicus]
MAAPFVPAVTLILFITILRYLGVVLMNLANKEKPMNKLFRFTLMNASCLCETMWAGIVGVVASGALSVQPLLGKHIEQRRH